MKAMVLFLPSLLLASAITSRATCCCLPHLCHPQMCWVFFFFHSWLFEGLGREKAEELLQLPNTKFGSFMIRESETRKGEKTLHIFSHFKPRCFLLVGFSMAIFSFFTSHISVWKFKLYIYISYTYIKKIQTHTSQHGCL